MEEKVWQLQEARDKFSKLIDKARKSGPQIVTKHGRKVAVVLSFEEYQEMVSSKGDLIEFFENSPLKQVNIDLSESRSREMPRKV